MSIMETKLRQRLDELRGEYDKGRATLQDIETQAANVRATLLRISGAIQVLQESLGDGVTDAASRVSAFQSEVINGRESHSMPSGMAAAPLELGGRG